MTEIANIREQQQGLLLPLCDMNQPFLGPLKTVIAFLNEDDLKNISQVNRLFRKHIAPFIVYHQLKIEVIRYEHTFYEKNIIRFGGMKTFAIIININFPGKYKEIERLAPQILNPETDWKNFEDYAEKFNETPNQDKVLALTNECFLKMKRKCYPLIPKGEKVSFKNTHEGVKKLAETFRKIKEIDIYQKKHSLFILLVATITIIATCLFTFLAIFGIFLNKHANLKILKTSFSFLKKQILTSLSGTLMFLPIIIMLFISTLSSISNVTMYLSLNNTTHTERHRLKKSMITGIISLVATIIYSISFFFLFMFSLATYMNGIAIKYNYVDPLVDIQTKINIKSKIVSFFNDIFLKYPKLFSEENFLKSITKLYLIKTAVDITLIASLAIVELLYINNEYNYHRQRYTNHILLRNDDDI